MRKGGLSAPKYYKRLSGSKNASKPEVSCFYCANAARNDLYGCALNVCKARSTVFRLTLFRATHNCASARPCGGVRICVPSSTVSNHDAWGQVFGPTIQVNARTVPITAVSKTI
jgi:hypothetical protein